jgi:putative FmdB family regulatory protein
MPIYDYSCGKCGKSTEVYRPRSDSSAPDCCGEPMTRQFSGELIIKMGYPAWVDRMDDIHKAQSDKGERLRYIYPQEVGAT